MTQLFDDQLQEGCVADPASAHHCPKHGWIPESHPTKDLILVRAFKVYDDKGVWSQCLLNGCGNGYDEDGNERPVEDYQADQGWFRSH